MMEENELSFHQKDIEKKSSEFFKLYYITIIKECNMFLIQLFKSLFFFTGSYSNQVFPDPLSLEEEEKCIDSMLAGNLDARNQLIEHNLRLVAHIVKKFETKDTDTDDLISIGTIGLIKGIDSYNKEKATRITTYVARCIENAVLT